MNKLIIIILILITAAGCSRKVLPVAEVRDSTLHYVYREVMEKDVVLVPDSALIHALLECDSLGRVYLKTIQTLQGQRVHQSIQLDDNILRVVATDQARERHLITTQQETLVRYKEIPVPVEVEVNRLNSWQAFQIWTGRLVMILLIIYAGWRIFKAKLNRIIKPFKP